MLSLNHLTKELRSLEPIRPDPLDRRCEGLTMIVTRFLESLEQMTVTCVGLSGPIEPNEVRIDQNMISIGQKKIQIIPEDTFRLIKDPMRFTQSQSNGGWSVTLILGAQLCKPIESPKLEEWCPPLDDLLNDWVFCHQHGNSPIDLGQLKPKSAPPLESIGQITFLLRKQPMMSSLLFESENKVDNLAVRVINPRIYIGSVASLDSSQPYKMKLHQAAAIQYKLLSKKDHVDEVKQLRHSFKVDWYVVSANLLNEVVKTIQRNDLNKIFLSQVIDPDGFLDAFI